MNTVKFTQPRKKLSVIENYFEQGLLDTVAGKFSPEYRLAAGQQLAIDYYRGRLQSITGIDYEKDRVDVSIKSEPDFVLDARDRYLKAIKDVPAEFWGVVNNVCCLDRQVKGVGNSQRQRLYNRNMQICDLCRGLDYVIKGYLSNGWRL